MLSKRTTEKETTPPTLHVGDLSEDQSDNNKKAKKVRLPSNDKGRISYFQNTGFLLWSNKPTVLP